MWLLAQASQLQLLYLQHPIALVVPPIRNLRHLLMASTYFTPATAASIKQLRNLQTLWLGMAGLYPGYVELDLTCLPQLSNVCIDAIPLPRIALPRQCRLHLSGNDDIMELETWSDIARHGQLQSNRRQSKGLVLNDSTPPSLLYSKCSVLHWRDIKSLGYPSSLMLFDAAHFCYLTHLNLMGDEIYVALPQDLPLEVLHVQAKSLSIAFLDPQEHAKRLQELRITYCTLRGANIFVLIPTMWDMGADLFAIAGAASIEAGGRNGYLHVQAVARVRMMADEVGRKSLRQHLKTFIPIQHGSGGTVDAKPLEAGQNLTYMLGYIQKDHGMPHYRLEAHNVSNDELPEGRKSYDDVRVDYVDGRIAINKANLNKHMYTFWTRDVAPVIKYMLRSGAYMPTAIWCMSPQGKGMVPSKLQAMWELVTGGLENCTIDQVRQLFFEMQTPDVVDARLVDPHWNQSLDELLQGVKRVRESYGEGEVRYDGLAEPRATMAPMADESDDDNCPEIDWEDLGDVI
ncbi:hypothetical protein COCOBI_18-3110 [Coccomyxa sp. Obi]|nr:hypothetical protein COCOBI_18-3110 [Coccomyxa sp. Obi]